MYEQTHLDNKLFLPPPVWDCMNGTSGEDWFEVIRNHEVTHYCKYYEERKDK